MKKKKINEEKMIYNFRPLKGEKPMKGTIFEEEIEESLMREVFGDEAVDAILENEKRKNKK